MNAAPDARIALRARGLLESADLSLRFLTAHARPFGLCTAAFALPGLLVSLALRYALELPWPAVWALSLALAALLEGPFTILAGQLALTPEVRVRAAAASFALRVLPFALVLIGTAVFVAAASLLFFGPAVFALLLTVFVPEVVLLERANFAAFRRAARLTQGVAGRAFGLVMLLWLVRAFAVVVTDEVLRRTVGVLLDLRISFESLVPDGGSPYALAGLWLSVPVCAVIRYVSYVDLRTLREGWDLQRRFQLLASAEGR